MLSIGVDWSEDFHLVALGRPGDGVIDVLRVEHRPEAVGRLLTRIARLEPEPDEVRVVIESRDGTDIWGTVGVSENVIEASWLALADSVEYKLFKDAESAAG